MSYVYLVTMEAVYDHGCAGVFTTREAAEQHATALLADSDGHHDFRVDEIPVDVPISLSGRYGYLEPEYWRREGSVTFNGWNWDAWQLETPEVAEQMDADGGEATYLAVERDGQRWIAPLGTPAPAGYEVISVSGPRW